MTTLTGKKKPVDILIILGILCSQLTLSAVSAAETDQTCVFTQYGTSYRGSISVTISGKTCQKWNSQSPHGHTFTSDRDFPDKSVEETGNNCRNPGGARDRPWCYTTDPNVEWEYCDIRACECTVNDGHIYSGKKSTTSSDKTCQRWDQQGPHKHSHTNSQAFPDSSVSEANNYCRSPDGLWKGAPWCYTSDPDKRWELCDIPQCECKESIRGESYRGRTSTTKSGTKCQSWVDQQPHPHNYRDNNMYSDGNVVDAGNYCRNPDGSAGGGPWCLTLDPDTRWEYCDIPMCEYTRPPRATAPPLFTTPYPGQQPPIRTVRQEAGVPVQECKFDERGTAYKGVVSNTVSGAICQRWDQQSPRLHAYTNPDLFPDASLSEASNQCRNPGNHALGPWCYTASGALGIEWEYCDVPLCHCKTSIKGEGYTGDVHTTVSGKACQSWMNSSPHQHPHVDSSFPDATMRDARNYCRNPSGEHSDGPWCLTLDPAVRWEYCDVPSCECSPDKTGHKYAGTKSTTRSGFTCQSWSDTSVHFHNYQNDDSAFVDGSVAKAKNYCRNPDMTETGGAWCYTTNKNLRWESCNIPECYLEIEKPEKDDTNKDIDPGTADCYEGDGTGYVGKTSLTKSGHQCQAWKAQSPNQHDYIRLEQYPDASIDDANNYCRNPLEGVDGSGPWCYTVTDGVRWETCGIPQCKATPVKTTPQPMLENIPYECLKSVKGTEYMGSLSITTSGRTCQSWDSQTPHPHSLLSGLEEAGNKCRNPGGGRDRPWCYTTDPGVEWEYCDIPACGCKTEIHGRNYTGPITRTGSGKPCQSWSLQTPNQHSYTDAQYFPDDTVTAAGAFCRNPEDKEPWGPWCFTNDPATRWEYCDVPACECRNTIMGLEYHGTQAITSSGLTCQAWKEQTPHSHSITDTSTLPDKNLNDTDNYCRNPVGGMVGERPWCYTTSTNIRWEYCDIPFCDGITLIDPPPPPKPKDCMESISGKEYRGRVSVTKTGKPCQRWSSQAPQRHEYTKRDFFPDRSLEEAGRYCRNPDDSGASSGVWCYTTDLNTRWEYCAVPHCPGVISTSTTSTKPTSVITSSISTVTSQDIDRGCKQERTGWTYSGEASTTVSGRLCQRWDFQAPHRHPHSDVSAFPDTGLKVAGNRCRNPGKWRPLGPWCYTTDPAVEWEYCQVDFCECRTSSSGTEYGGQKYVTISGKTCQKWTTQSPHSHRYFDSRSFPDGEVEEASNYCRNPDPQTARTPWCYTTDPNVRWEYCEIPLCDDLRLPMITPTSSGDPIAGPVTGIDSSLRMGDIAAIVLGILLLMLIAAIAIVMYKYRRIFAKNLKAERYQPQPDPSRDVGLTFYNNRNRTADRTITMVSLDWPKQEVNPEAILQMRPNETLENPTEAASLDDNPPVTVL